MLGPGQHTRYNN